MLTKSLKIIFFLLMLYACYLLVLLSIPYLSFDSSVEFLSTKQFVYHIKSWRWSFYIHVFSSVFIILAGLFQFNKWIISRDKKTHKILGYIYVFLVLIVSGPAAFVMSLYANGGFWVQLSFVILSVLWIFSTLFALILILNKKIERHGNWLLRSFSLTLSAVTLRFYAFLLDYFNVKLGPIETYILISYISWIPNLIVAEILIRKGFVRNLLYTRGIDSFH
jgi:uncharacterized membrane protein